MSDDFVENDEILYRRIAASRKLYKIKDDGTIEIRSTAFGDREFKISVDRAKLCKNNPQYTMGDEPGVVIFLVTEQVCNIDNIARNDAQGNPIRKFKIIIKPAPQPSNPAHAEISAIPEFEGSDQSGAFHRLCRRLARLAEAGQWIELP